MKFKQYLFDMARNGKVIAVYVYPASVKLIVENYRGVPLEDYRQQEVSPEYLNRWLAAALREALLGSSYEQFNAILEELKK